MQLNSNDTKSARVWRIETDRTSRTHSEKFVEKVNNAVSYPLVNTCNVNIRSNLSNIMS